MKFTLQLQDPDSEALTFLELLLGAAIRAEQGGAIFAFATVDGVRLLLDNPIFSAFLARGTFELIVGVDAVTVPAALAVLEGATRAHENLTVRVFFHERIGILFHPKLCWFAKDDKCRVLVGSANLTRGGLLKNWEAIGDAALEGADSGRLLDAWNAWLSAKSEQLFEVGDQRVVARAGQNEGDERRRHEEDQVEEADADLDAVATDAPVLLAEIPRGRDRWNQANFDLVTFREFFQVRSGMYHQVLLSPVEETGVVGSLEVRQGVSVKSHNFRIELGQAAGRVYPDDGRPIGAFVRVGTRRFRYRVLMPGQVEHSVVSTILDSRWAGRARQLRRITLSLEEFRTLVPEVVL